MSDPLVKKVTADDGTEQWVASGGPADTDATAATDTLTGPAPAAEPADPNDPDADQPAHIVTEEGPGAAEDAADGDSPDAGAGERRP